MDHHIPLALGGHLTPGNIVSLCRTCNNRKSDKSPERFYTREELERLQALLDQQEELFRFEFDWELWREDREKYLLSVGVEPKAVKDTLYNEDHPDFLGIPSNNHGFISSVDISHFLALLPENDDARH
jgi:hypothetical protein